MSFNYYTTHNKKILFDLTNNCNPPETDPIYKTIKIAPHNHSAAPTLKSLISE